MIYGSVIQAKSGEPVPVFADGKAMHSKYSPSAERLPLPEERREGFFLIGGIGAGYHIQNLIDTLETNYAILAFETDGESLAFCRQFPAVKELEGNPHVTLCGAGEVADLLPDRYVPSVYGGIVYSVQRAWQGENAALCQRLGGEISALLEQISADYSVQCHFGKLWQRNILANLSSFTQNPRLRFDTGRTAAVIAAGPSLDGSIGRLRAEREAYTVIATDTTYGPLLKNAITPDIVLSVDGQHVSTSHFYCCPPRAQEPDGAATTFVFDLCTSPEAAELIRSRGYSCFFVQSGHPLSLLVGRQGGIPFLETGAGTVTIACCDFARLLGYRKLRLFGADFSYSAGKPYTKGTYLDAQFLGGALRTAPAEQKYVALMYRTPLRQQAAGVYTTDTLRRYAATLQGWLARHGYVPRDGGYHAKSAAPLSPAPQKPFDFPRFMADWGSRLAQAAENGQWRLDAYTATLLPYMAYLRSQKDMDKAPVLTLFKLAYSQISRYSRYTKRI